MGNGELLGLHPHTVDRHAASLHGDRLIILVRRQHPPFQHARQFGFLAPGELDVLALGPVGCDQIGGGDRGQRGAAPRHEAQQPLAFHGIEAEIPGQRRDGGARAFEGRDHESRHGIGQARDIERIRIDPRPGANRPHQIPEAGVAQATVQPVPDFPIGRVAPDIAAAGPGGIGPPVPAPDRAFAHVDHRGGIDGGCRVVARIRPVADQGFQIAALDRVVPRPGREMRQLAFRAFRVEEDVRLVGALVDGGAADLGEADRLSTAAPTPWRWRSRRRPGGSCGR